MYKLQFVGSGGGLGSPKENYHSNAIIYKEPQNILGIDCGSTFQAAIEDLGISINHFDGFYITHLHADHVGGLEWVGFKRYFSTWPFGQDNPILYGNAELLDDLWEQTLSGGMESLQGQKNTLSTYFNPHSIPPNGHFHWEDIHFSLVQTVHVVDDRRIKPSFGLMITLPHPVTGKPGKRIFFTGDTQFCPSQIMTYYEQADVIFQDCELATYPNSVHAQYRELFTLPDNIKNKMWLYHYSGKLPAQWETGDIDGLETDGFLGFVKKGQIFEL